LGGINDKLGSVSGAGLVTTVGKFGFFCVAVFLVVTLVRRTSAWSNVSEAWAMHKCPRLLQDDVDVLLSGKDPHVLSCVGPAKRAICQVQTTERWAPARCGWVPAEIKTAPLGPWDCTRRQVPTGTAGVLMSMMLSGKMGGLSSEEFQEMLDRVSPDDKQLIANRDFLASLLAARQTLADQQGSVRR
jgi:hypothetical protein